MPSVHERLLFCRDLGYVYLEGYVNLAHLQHLVTRKMLET